MHLRIAFLLVGLLFTTSSSAAPPARLISGAMRCLSEGCDLDSGPVCAVDDSGMPQTFPNRCMADLAYCSYGTYYAVVKHGEC